MKTEKIYPLLFKQKIPKQRFVTENMRSNIKTLLVNMNAEVKTKKRGDYFFSTLTRKLKSNSGATFEDERRFKKQVSDSEQMSGFSVLEFGNTRLDIDNENGEIIDYKKPFFKPWFLVLKKAEEILNHFKTNFNNKNIVQKEKIELQDLTPDGDKKIKRMIIEFEKKRLKEAIDRLEKELGNNNG